MTQPCRIGVLGGGSIGLRHAANLRQLGHGNVVVLEPSPAARERFDGAIAEGLVATREEFWEARPDVVFVCTPSQHHLADATEALTRGCDVFVEKPLAVSLEGCDALATKATENSCVTMVACNMRFHPGPIAVKALIEDGRIGAILAARLHCGSFLPDWRPWQDYKLSYSADSVSGGAILDCIHEIDLALWYLGPGSLQAAVVRKGGSIGLPDTDAIAELLIAHDSGALGSVHLNFLQRNYSRGCEIVGTLGTIRWDFEVPEVHIHSGDGTATVSLPADYDLNAMYLDEARHFLDCVAARRPTCNPLDGGLAALRIALDAKSASR
ncbi:MAG: Gfo/Idh/MocA family protein [Chthoniobacterales bacterium]